MHYLLSPLQEVELEICQKNISYEKFIFSKYVSETPVLRYFTTSQYSCTDIYSLKNGDQLNTSILLSSSQQIIESQNKGKEW